MANSNQQESGGLGKRLAGVEQRLAAAAERAGRDGQEIILVAVGKTQTAERLAEAVRAGARHLGENRVREAEAKKDQVPAATWHLIGPLQRNKAGRALDLFDFIHTVDRPEIARRLQFLLKRSWPGRVQPVLMEINIGAEPSKAGVLPEDARALVREVSACDRLDLRGLMAIPPRGPTAEDSRVHFRRLRNLRDDLSQEFSLALPHLSMGMSHDFEVAIEEGATMVRVGTAIFGPRG